MPVCAAARHSSKFEKSHILCEIIKAIKVTSMAKMFHPYAKFEKMLQYLLCVKTLIVGWILVVEHSHEVE